MTAADLPGVTVDDVERTARDATHAQWTVAGIGMAGSALAAYFAIDHLGETGLVGVVTAATADLALIWWLRIAKRLRAAGQHSRSGFVLEVATAIVMLYQNLGAAVFKLVQPGTIGAYWLLGIEHIFIPILLVLSFIAFDDAAFKLGKVGHRIKAAEQAKQADQLDADQAVADAAAEATQLRQERDTAQAAIARLTHDVTRLRDQLERQTTATQATTAQLEQAQAETRQARAETQEARAEVANLRKRFEQQPPPAKRSSTRPAKWDVSKIREWVRGRLINGISTENADLVKQFPGYQNGHRIIREVTAHLADEKKHLHLAGGKR
jgi:hypothetical protein